MKQKSNKLRKLEKNRYSILTNDLEHCYICSLPSIEIHEIFAGSNRQQSMKNGFTIPVCRACHRTLQLNEIWSRHLKEECQAKFEETHSKEEFIKIIGKNYL